MTTILVSFDRLPSLGLWGRGLGSGAPGRRT